LARNLSDALQHTAMQIEAELDLPHGATPQTHIPIQTSADIGRIPQVPIEDFNDHGPDDLPSGILRNDD